MKRSLEQRFSELYISNMDIIGEGLPESVNSDRRGFLETFNLLSLPSAKSEKYRHCDMREVFEGEWEHYFTPPKAEPIHEIPIKGYKLEVVNGFYRGVQPLVRLENGIIYGSLAAAMVEHSELVLKYYNSAADNENSAVTALNSLFTQDGAFIYVPEGVDVDQPFVVTFEYGSKDEEEQMSFARMLVVVENDAKAEMVVSNHSNGSARFLVNHVRETIVNDRAELNYSEVSHMGVNSAIVLGNYLQQNAHSVVNMQNLWFDKGVTRVNAITDLIGSYCDSNLYGLFMNANKELTDINIDVNHMVPDCQSMELVKGVVADSAVGAFTGIIYVEKDAQRTDAFQHSRNIQLGENARIYTEPQLEIYADDVKCSHGATVGQLDSDAIYYMRQRGLTEEEAKRLQLYGFVNDIISRCPIEDAAEFIRTIAEERIKAL